jgi:hypothetical protein
MLFQSGGRNSVRTLTVMLSVLLLAQGGLRAQQSPVYDTPQEVVPPTALTLPPAPEVITTADGYDNFEIGLDNAEPHGSSNPQNPLWHFNAFNTNRTHRTTNGHDWTFLGPGFGTGFSMRGDPVAAYDSLGNLYYENMFSATPGGAILGCKVIRSTNNGATWTVLGTAIDGVDKNWLTCDQTAGPYANFVYTTMTASGGGNFTRSTDFGASWVHTWTFGEQGLPGMMVAVGPDVLGGNNVSGGCVYVVTNGNTTENSIYTFSRSTDGGASFQQMSSMSVAGYVGTINSIGRLAINNARTRPYPFIAADNSYGPYRGRLHLVYAANDPPGNGNKPDIFHRYSTDQGATWSTRTRVNDNADPTSTNEWFPAIWCDKETGRLYIQWYDMRNDPTNVRAWVYGTYTDDGGATFAPNQKISNTDQTYPNPACVPNTNCYRGDYDAVSSNRYSSLSVWTDFRNGNYASYAAYFPDFAMQLSATADTLQPTDSTDVFLRIPAVKLYTHPVLFSATLLGAAPITFEFPDGDTLASFPDSLRLRIRSNGAAPGTYFVSVMGAGPNGTPVHKRTITVTVLVPAITMIAPVGGEVWQTGGLYSIRWGSVLAGSDVRIELSRDGGVTFPETLFAATANDGIEPWLVTGPGMTTARVRVTSLSNPTLSDTSAANFAIGPAVSVLPGWNLVSVPSVPPDARREVIFPSSVSPAYTFLAGGYHPRDTLTNGGGYWLRFETAGVVSFTGASVSADTVDIRAGWSLLGSISYPVLMDSIEQIPPGIIMASFGYVPGSGYQANPPQIQPGQALWIRANAAGQVVLRQPAARPLSVRPKGTRMRPNNTD